MCPRTASHKVVNEANQATPGLSLHLAQAQAQCQKEALEGAEQEKGPTASSSTGHHDKDPTPQTLSKHCAPPSSEDETAPVKKSG
jgi:hypothetical protein